MTGDALLSAFRHLFKKRTVRKYSVRLIRRCASGLKSTAVFTARKTFIDNTDVSWGGGTFLKTVP